MTDAAGPESGPGGFCFAPKPESVPDLTAALQLGHDQGINGGTVEDHLAHAWGFVATVQSFEPIPTRLVDLGSGGGYPGLVLAYCLPFTEVTLVEVREKRADYLRRALRALGLDDRATVFTGDAATLGVSIRAAIDVVTARSFGSPGATAEYGAPLLRIGGRLLVSEPPTGSLDGRWPEDGLAQLGLGPPAVTTVGTTKLMLATKATPTPSQYPRRRRQTQQNPVF